MAIAIRPFAFDGSGSAATMPVGRPAPPVANTAEPTPQRHHRGLWIGLAAVGAIAILGAAVVFGLSALDARRSDQAIAGADEHWAATAASLDTLSNRVSDVQAASSETLPGAVAALQNTYNTTSKPLESQLAQAEQHIAALKAGSATRAQYQAAIDAARLGLERLESAMKESANLGGLLSDSALVSQLWDEGFSAGNASVSASNSRDWSKAVALAEKSLASYKRAAAKLDDMAALAPDDDFGQDIATIKLQIRLAQTELAIARAGKARDNAAYTAQVKAYDALVPKVNAAEIEEKESDPALLVEDLKASLAGFSNQASAAQRLHAQAVQTHNSGAKD